MEKQKWNVAPEATKNKNGWDQSALGKFGRIFCFSLLFLIAICTAIAFSSEEIQKLEQEIQLSEELQAHENAKARGERSKQEILSDTIKIREVENLRDQALLDASRAEELISKLKWERAQGRKELAQELIKEGLGKQ